MRMRKAAVNRNTAETRISVKINLDGRGNSAIDTTIPFMNHMLELFSKHSLIDLKLDAIGDTHIDAHHIVEDIGIVMGQAIKEALDKKKGIARYGHFLLPMDEALSYIALDLSGRGHLSYKVKFASAQGTFDYSLIKEFFRALAYSAGITLHIKGFSGENNHHTAESLFKGFAKALFHAASVNKRVKGVPSTKKLL